MRQGVPGSRWFSIFSCSVGPVPALSRLSMAFGPSIDRPDPPTPPLYAVERSHKTSPWYFSFETRVALPVKYSPLSLREIRTLLRGRGWAGYAPVWTPASHPLQARAFAT